MASDPTSSASPVLRQGIKTHSPPTACQKLPPNFATRNLCTSSVNGVKAGKARSPPARCIEHSRQLDPQLASILRRSLDGSLLSARIRSEVFARHHLTGMLAPSLKRVNPQSLMFFEIRHFELLQTRVHHSQMINRVATWHIVVPFIEKGTLVSSGTYLGSDYVPLSVPR